MRTLIMALGAGVACGISSYLFNNHLTNIIVNVKNKASTLIAKSEAELGKLRGEHEDKAPDSDKEREDKKKSEERAETETKQEVQTDKAN